MNASHKGLLILLAVAAAAMIGWRATAWRSAAGEFEDAYAEHASVAARTERIIALRALPPVSGYGSRPADDVIQLANRVLESAALPAARLRGVQTEGDRAVTDDRGSSDGRRLATVRLALEPLTVQELGALLGAWRANQQVWSVARVEMNALPPSSSARTAGQYRASVTVSASYIDDPAPATTPASGKPITASPPAKLGPLVHPTPNGASK